jgi:hypothetical protein
VKIRPAYALVVCVLIAIATYRAAGVRGAGGAGVASQTAPSAPPFPMQLNNDVGPGDAK